MHEWLRNAGREDPHETEWQRVSCGESRKRRAASVIAQRDHPSLWRYLPHSATRPTARRFRSVKHVPNALTIGRILVAPVSLYLLWTGTFTGQLVGTTLFILAAITDWLDGRLARKYGVGSRLGQFLDPLADKVLVLGAFVLVPFLAPLDDSLAEPAGAWLPWLAVGAIAARDIGVTWLRSVYEKRNRPLRTLTAAKWKTAWQLTFLISVFVFLTASHGRGMEGALGSLFRGVYAVLRSPGPLVFLVVTAAITVYTGVLYFTGREESELV